MFWFVFCIQIFFLVFLGQLVEVKTSPQPHIACQTLDTIFNKKLNIACNSDALLYINQLTLKNLGQQSDAKADNESECQRTSVSSCFSSIPSDIPWNYTFYCKVSKICNGKHNCSLESRDFVSYVTQFRDQFTCSNRGHFYYTRIGCFFECFLSKCLVFENYKRFLSSTITLAWLLLNYSIIFYSYFDIMSVFPSDSFIVPLPYVFEVKFSFKWSIFFIVLSLSSMSNSLHFNLLQFKRLFFIKINITLIPKYYVWLHIQLHIILWMYSCS